MLRRWVRRATICVTVIIVLLIGFILFLHTSAGKSLVREKLQSFLQKKWKTEVLIRDLDYRLPNWIALEGVIIRDAQKDTVLNGGRLYVRINLLRLLSNKVDVTALILDDVSIFCHRRKNDSLFNFQFILDAFAPAPENTRPRPEGKPLHLSIKELALNNVRFKYEDQREGLYFSVSLGRLHALPASLRPERTSFNLHDLSLQNTDVVIIDSSVSDPAIEKSFTKTGNPAAVLMKLGALQLRNVSLSYKLPFFRTDYSFLVDDLQLRQVDLDLAKKNIDVESLALTHASLKLNTWIASQKASKITEETIQIKNEKWKFHIKTISLTDNSFAYKNAATSTQRGLDFDHMDARSINLYSKNNSLDPSGFSCDLKSASALYNKQLQVKQVSCNIRLSDSIVKFQDLITVFNQSQLKIRGDVIWRLKPTPLFSNNSQFRIDGLSVLYKDLLWIQPTLKEQLPFSLQPSDKIMLTGNFSGASRGLKAEQLTLSSSGRQFNLKAGVELKIEESGPAISAVFQDLRLKRSLLSEKLLQRLQKENLYLPEELSLTGIAGVNSQHLIADIKLTSEYGQLQIKGVAENIHDPRRSAYQFTLEGKGFESGKWIGLEQVLGKITGRITIRGKGVQPNSLAATARLELDSAVVNNYRFQNIILQAGLNQGSFTVRSTIHDPNLETDFELKGRFGPGFSVQGTTRVTAADFLKLGLSEDSLQYAGNITVDASYREPNKIDAFVLADSNTVFIHGKNIEAKRLLFKCHADADTMQISFHAPFADAQLEGNYSAEMLASETEAIWKAIYPLQDAQSENQHRLYPVTHRTSLDLSVKQDALLSAFLPQLHLMQPVNLQMRYAFGENDSGLAIQLNAPDLSYGEIELRGWSAKAGMVDSIVQFSLTGNHLIIGKNKLTGADISGKMQKGLLTVKAEVNDSAGKKYYAGHVNLAKEKDEMTIRFLDDLTLNRNNWKVSQGNAIRLVEKGLIIHQLGLESRGQKIFFNTKEQASLSPIAIRLDSLGLQHVFSFLFPGDSLGASGMINAEFSVQQPIEKIPLVTGDIKLTNLSLHNIALGDFGFHSANTGDSLSFEGVLSGANQLHFNGALHLKNKGFYLQSTLQKINMDVVKAFTKDLFADISGKITGQLQMAGSLDLPTYKGLIQMDSTRFSLIALNTLYRIDKQKLLIDDTGLHLEHFALSDSFGNKLSITGRLGSFSSREQTLDLAVQTKNFMLLNASRNSGASLYGRGIIDASLFIKGTIDAPVIVGDAALLKKTEVYLVSGNNTKTKRTRTDGILFVDIDTIGSQKNKIPEPTPESALVQKTKKGLKYDLNLTVDKDAQFNMVIDPSSGDELLMSGDARLKAGIADNGNIGLEGVYNLQAGYYKMNNLLLRGKFLLVKGSSISFNGDPSLAEADVTTEYVVEASPKGLLNYKESDDAAYTQRVPFGVIFMIRGPISKPKLSFDIQLKPGKGVLKSSVKSDVEHALDRLRTDVAEMNKQVFSLLLTKRFSVSTGNNSLENSNLNANNALKEGMSSFLSEAMNQIADQLIKGVDVDVNMKTYKSEDDPISKTDVGVAVSKDLMEDRLVIRIEENFPMGNSSTPVKSGSQYIPDITSTYKLSKDGRFKLKAYQKNEYDAVVQGFFTEIGVNFTIEVSYEKFKELLQRRKNLSDDK